MMRTVEASLALVFLLGACSTRRPLWRCTLVALCMTSTGLVLVPDLVAPPGPARVVAWTLAVGFSAAVAALAVLLAADGLLVLRREGLARPQAATFAGGLALATVVGLAVLIAVRGGRALAGT